MVNKFKKYMNKVLKMVVKHQIYFSTHPKQLALLMQEYDDLHYASRYHENEELHDWENLKYAVIDLEEQVDKDYAALVYDAWVATIEKEEISNHPLERKKNKTMEEIVSMCLDPEYRYKSIFPNRRSVLNHYLCTIGAGKAWNKDGFIGDKEGPSGCDMELFSYFWEETMPSNIKKEMTWLDDAEINQYRKKMKNSKKKSLNKEEGLFASFEKIDELLKKINPKKYASEQKKKAEDLKSYPFYPMVEDYSLICTMPENAHESFKKAAVEICEDILSNSREDKNNKKIATKILKKLKV
jgi:hypothetical protein